MAPHLFVKETGISGLWTIPPDALDEGNALASGCHTWMVTYQLAVTHPEVLTWLYAHYFQIIIRLEEYLPDPTSPTGRVHRYDADWKQVEVMQGLHRAFATAQVPISALAGFICGVEPENEIWTPEKGWHPLDFTWDTTTGWHENDLAPAHAFWVGAFIDKWQADPLLKTRPFITPGWTSRDGMKSEHTPPDSGMVSWAEAVRHKAYNRAHGNGGHVYLFGWDSEVDRQRLNMLPLKILPMLFHRELWLDEIGVPGNPENKPGVGKDDLYQMACYIDIFKELEDQSKPWGKRVAVATIFTGNGTGIGWDPSYLIKDPDAWEKLGRHMAGLPT